MPRWVLPIGLLLLAGCAPSATGAPLPQAARGVAGAPAETRDEVTAAAAPAPAPAPAPADEAPVEAEDDLHAADDEEAPDDHLEDEEPADATGEPAPVPQSPLVGMADAEIERLLREDPAALGSISLGATNAGRLFNGVQMPEGEGWKNISPAYAWGTQETIDYLIRAIHEARRQHPESPPLYLGHISAKHGGPLSPHRSHQAGRDLDISYYLDPQRPGFHRANAKNLDRARTWSFVRALITETDVEMILIDTSIQKLLKEHALAIGEDPAWVDSVFQYRSRSPRPLIRHARGHANHIHVRFYNPIAQASAARAHALLVKHGKVKAAPAGAAAGYIQHKVRNGQTLGILARKYGVTVEAIQRANGLKGTFIKAKRVLNIPRPGVRTAPASRPPMLKPPVIPPRRLPPEKAAAAGAGKGPAEGG